MLGVKPMSTRLEESKPYLWTATDFTKDSVPEAWLVSTWSVAPDTVSGLLAISLNPASTVHRNYKTGFYTGEPHDRRVRYSSCALVSFT